jgi:hypothetical protein
MHFVQLEGSFPCPQQPSHSILTLWFHLRQVFHVFSFFHLFQTNIIMYLSSPLYVPHDLPISPSFICSQYHEPEVQSSTKTLTLFKLILILSNLYANFLNKIWYVFTFLIVHCVLHVLPNHSYVSYQYPVTIAATHYTLHCWKVQADTQGRQDAAVSRK